MALKLYLTDFARDQLRTIHDFHTSKVNSRTAEKLILNLLDEMEKLRTHPLLGVTEVRLANRKRDLRALIVKNYKVIYTVSFDTGVIDILDIFDTRQNPSKLKRSR